VAAGHKWNGYFFLAMFAAFILDALERRTPVFETAVKLALINFFILLQGTIHIYALCMIFLGLLFLCSNRARWTALLAGFFTGLLSVFRLAPAAMTLGKLSASEFENGYGSVRSVIDRLDSSALLKTASFPWEYDLYIGLFGVAFVLIFGVWLAFSKRPELAAGRFRGLHLPLLILLLLSLGDLYQQLITHLPAAFPNTERVPSRFMILPLVFLAVLACARFQRMYQRFIQIRWFGLGMLGVIFAMLIQLRYHWALWRMSSIERSYASLAPNLPLPNIITLNDPGYERAVLITLAFSLLVLISLVVVLFWRRHRAPVSAPIAPELYPSAPVIEVTQADRRRTVIWTAAIIGLFAAITAGREVHRWIMPEGLWVTYYEDTQMKFPAWRGVERDLVRDFQDDPPVPWILPRGFSTRWSGYLNVPREDDYVFYSQSSDGLRFYLDEHCVLDNWRRQEFITSGNATNLHLTAGLHPLKVEHYSHNMAGALRIRWCGGGIPENTLLAAPYLRKHP
jgi:hypothetical protein